jgi:hypothetical protein
MSEQWNEVKGLVNDINVNAIQELEAPSNNSFDRVLIASLKITDVKNAYEASTFDHRNPEVALKKSINKLFEVIN